MTTFTTNQWAILVLVLVLGWLLGLASRSGAGRWRRAYETERSDNLRLRADTDARIAAADARIADLERQAVVAPRPVAPAAMATVPVTGDAARDDLSLIRGVGPSGAARLDDFGIHSYRDIVAMSAADEAALESRMGAEPGFIERERWREQAETLAAAQGTARHGMP